MENRGAKGLHVDTFGLGGDSAVRFKNDRLYLDTRHVIPVSLLAKEYPQVTDNSKAWLHFTPPAYENAV